MNDKYAMLLAVLAVATAWAYGFQKQTGIEVPWLPLAKKLLDDAEKDDA